MLVAAVEEIYSTGDDEEEKDTVLFRANTAEELYEQLAEYKAGSMGYYGSGSGYTYNYLIFREADALNFREEGIENTKAWKEYQKELAVRQAARAEQEAIYARQNEVRQYELYLTLKERFEPKCQQETNY